jgi:hypothetical protein
MNDLYPAGVTDLEIEAAFGGVEDEETECGVCGRVVPESETETRWMGSCNVAVCDSPECIRAADQKEAR